MVLTIGLDVGTQGAKGVVYDDEQKIIVARASVEYGLLPTNVVGRAEQDPEQWMDACVQLINIMLHDVSRETVVSIGVSGQQHGLVPVDKEGTVIRQAKLWCDVESKKEAQCLSELLGITIVPSLTLPKVLWLKNNEPENYAKLDTILLPHDYMNFRLTGKKRMECGDASGIGALDIYSREFDNNILQLVDEKLKEKLPPILGPNEVLGKLKPEVSELLGLSEKVFVSPGSGDNMMSALGSGAVSDGVLVLSLGTSGTLFGCSEKPIFDRDGIICPFCDATGRWLPLVCTMSCTGVLEEVKKCFNLSHNELTTLAEQEPIGCNGVNFLPYLKGERTPNWPLASGVIHGLSPGCLRPGLLYRAAIEGVTFTLLNGLKSMKKLGMTSKELRVVGGGSKNPLWRKIIADSFQIPLKFPLESESAALGAALQAGAVWRGVEVAEYILQQEVPVSEETLLPDTGVKLAYQKAYDRHVELGNLLFSSSQ
eukprot:g810.t1